MKPYQHGGDIAAFAKVCECGIDEVIDLSSNINSVKPKLDIDLNNIDISPYPNYDKLYDSISSHYRVDADQVELFNGASSAIFALFAHLHSYNNLQKCAIYSPAYLEYKRAASLLGYDVHLINRFAHKWADVPPNSLVVFVNPSTPDGAWYKIDRLLETWHDMRCTVLVDESFLDFTDYRSATSLIDKYPNLYVLKSMTKFYGAAGVRIGALISQQANITAIKKHEAPWKISALDAAYIISALADRDFKKRSNEINSANKNYLLEILRYSPLVGKIYPSQANYILIELDTLTANELQQMLTPHKVLIRNCQNFDGLSDHHVRIAVKEREKLSALAEVFGG